MHLNWDIPLERDNHEDLKRASALVCYQRVRIWPGSYEYAIELFDNHQQDDNLECHRAERHYHNHNEEKHASSQAPHKQEAPHHDHDDTDANRNHDDNHDAAATEIVFDSSVTQYFGTSVVWATRNIARNYPTLSRQTQARQGWANH
jgi:hypothetical protein